MLKYFVSIIALVYTVSLFAQQENKSSDSLVWYTDLMQVHELSQSTQKPIFGFFTGSDWCGWCHKLQRDVFNKTAFIEWASQNVILLELDFPRRKQLPENLMNQNYMLQQAFGVRGYPTIWLFFTEKDAASNNINISALGSLGYPTGAEIGKEEVTFLNNANMILANHKKK